MNGEPALSSTESMRISLESIRTGDAGLNQHRKNLLARAPEIGDWARLQLNSVEEIDLAYLSAATQNEFALLRGKTMDILLHGDPGHCSFDEELLEMLRAGKLRLIVHSHPDYDQIVPSPEDRKFLQYIGQESSRIISWITGRAAPFTSDPFEIE